MNFWNEPEFRVAMLVVWGLCATLAAIVGGG